MDNKEFVTIDYGAFDDLPEKELEDIAHGVASAEQAQLARSLSNHEWWDSERRRKLIERERPCYRGIREVKKYM